MAHRAGSTCLDSLKDCANVTAKTTAINPPYGPGLDKVPVKAKRE
ncbi:MAG: hypothetical protein PUH82_07480 [Bacteroidales bacterium]|nr:hypothetical protein [Candidatus Cryptobacteroides sp.]MDD7136177.1 hypothetical protein [Bacteroidales bacterium]MDY5566437.1 hypothetical protein [Candidatus Cryptobacteroides sp.]